MTKDMKRPVSQLHNQKLGLLPLTNQSAIQMTQKPSKLVLPPKKALAPAVQHADSLESYQRSQMEKALSFARMVAEQQSGSIDDTYALAM